MFLLLKRLFDLTFSLILLLSFSLILIFIFIFIKIDSPNDSAIYKGKRASINNKTFKILKFRTMLPDAEHTGGFSTSLDDERLTSIGRRLRKYKLDELPQMFNILKGEMSFVGPRPQVTYYTDKYFGENSMILNLKPGIIGLASLYFLDMDSTLGKKDVDKKYETEIEPVKNRLRVYYVKNSGIKLDLFILISTLLIVFPFYKRMFDKKISKII